MLILNICLILAAVVLWIFILGAPFKEQLKSWYDLHIRRD